MIKDFHGLHHQPILIPRQFSNSPSTIRIGRQPSPLGNHTHTLTTMLQRLCQLRPNTAKSRALTKSILKSMENTSSALTLNARTYGSSLGIQRMQFTSRVNASVMKKLELQSLNTQSLTSSPLKLHLMVKTIPMTIKHMDFSILLSSRLPQDSLAPRVPLK